MQYKWHNVALGREYGGICEVLLIKRAAVAEDVLISKYGVLGAFFNVNTSVELPLLHNKIVLEDKPIVVDGAWGRSLLLKGVVGFYDDELLGVMDDLVGKPLCVLIRDGFGKRWCFGIDGDCFLSFNMVDSIDGKVLHIELKSVQYSRILPVTEM